MYCDAKEIRFRNREELTLKSKAKTFIIDILLDNDKLIFSGKAYICDI